MNIDPQSEVTIAFSDLNEVRTLLLMCQQHHEARDLSDSAANILPEVIHRPITKEINRVLQRVEGILSEALLNAMQEDDEIALETVDNPPDFDYLSAEAQELETELAELEGEEEILPDNPLGTRTITPRQSTFEWTEEDDSRPD